MKIREQLLADEVAKVVAGHGSVVKLGGEAGLFPEDVIDVLEGLSKHALCYLRDELVGVTKGT